MPSRVSLSVLAFAVLLLASSVPSRARNLRTLVPIDNNYVTMPRPRAESPGTVDIGEYWAAFVDESIRRLHELKAREETGGSSSPSLVELDTGVPSEELTRVNGLAAALQDENTRVEGEVKEVILGTGTRASKARQKCLASLQSVQFCYETDPALLSMESGRQLKEDIAAQLAKIEALSSVREDKAVPLVTAVKGQLFQQQFILNHEADPESNLKLDEILLPLGGTQAGSDLASWYIDLIHGSDADRAAAGPLFEKITATPVSEAYVDVSSEALLGILAGNVNPETVSKEKLAQVIKKNLGSSVGASEAEVVATIVKLSDPASKALAIEEELANWRLTKAGKTPTPRMRNALGALLAMIANGYSTYEAFGSRDGLQTAISAVSTAADGAAALEKLIAANPALDAKNSGALSHLEKAGKAAKPLAILDFCMTFYTLVTLDAVYTSTAEALLVSLSMVLKFFVIVTLFVPGGQLAAAILAGIAFVFDLLASAQPSPCEMARNYLDYTAGNDNSARAWVDVHKVNCALNERSALTLRAAVKQCLDGWTGYADSEAIHSVYHCLAEGGEDVSADHRKELCAKMREMTHELDLSRVTTETTLRRSIHIREDLDVCGAVSTTDDDASRDIVDKEDDIVGQPKENLARLVKNLLVGSTLDADEDRIVTIMCALHDAGDDGRKKLLWILRQPGTSYNDIVGNLHGVQDTQVRRCLIKPVTCYAGDRTGGTYIKATGSCERTTLLACGAASSCQPSGSCSGQCICETSGVNECLCAKRLTATELEDTLCESAHAYD